MIPFEFIIEGPPVSLQTRNRARLQQWKTDVATEARRNWPAGDLATADKVKFSVTYYHENDSPDVDNIIKPIQDALVGIVYVDDNQVHETRSRRRDINSAFRIRGASPIVVQGFLTGRDFLHIKVEEYQQPQIID
jgi:crossover junction endodeoxyribonuclease RusA